MAPTRLPAPFHRDGWVFEEKVDGYRMLAYKDGAGVRLISRTGVDHTRRYPEVLAAIARLKAAAFVLDGELAIFDEQLHSRFDWLRQPATELATPPVLIAFDLLYVNGHNVATRPLRERRRRLEDVLGGADFVYPVRRLADDGLQAWTEVLERGYEGLVAKTRRAPTWAARRARGRGRRLAAPRRGAARQVTTRPRLPSRSDLFKSCAVRAIPDHQRPPKWCVAP